jgi:hypothetical protein
MAYLDDLKSFSFGGFDWPYQRMQVQCVLRDHVHEYPHVPGGAAEKQARKLYDIRVTSQFDESIGRNGGKFAGRNLLSDVGTLQEWFELGATLPLYIPNMGAIQAYIREFSRTLDVTNRSGEALELNFREDLGEEFSVATRLEFAGGVTATLLGDLEMLSPDPKPNIFQQITEAVNSLIAFRDTAQMWAGLVEAKILGLRALFEEADRTLDLFNDPENWPLLEALKALWASIEEFAETALGIDEFQTYTLPQQMTADEVSEALYSDTIHATDILNWNALPDPYNIPAGTSVKWLPEA